MKILLWIIAFFGILLGLVFFGMIMGVISLPFHAASNLIETAHDITDKTLNADNTIYNYEWFKQQYEDISATEKKIIIAQNAIEGFVIDAGGRKDWTFEDKTESARLNSIRQGLMGQLEEMIATYNARSKMANRNIFLNGLIPEYLELGSNILTSL